MTTTHSTAKNEVAGAFVQRHQSDVIGVLHGWDRLRLQGTLRSLYDQPVMEEYLWQSGVLWKDFKRFATDLTPCASSVREVGRAASTSADLSPFEPHTQGGSGPPDPTTRQGGQRADRCFELRRTVSHLVFARQSSDPQAGDQAAVG
jgi:hypothetical protein